MLKNNPFTEDELSRGVYRYDCETDMWYPVPRMKTKVSQGGVTTNGELLYLVGGINAGSRLPIRSTQSYDYRAGKWQQFPKTLHSHTSGVSCCVQQEKL